MSKKIIIPALITSVFIYIASVCYFSLQEYNLKSTFLEDVKKANRAELIVNGFKDTLINTQGDTTFINIPAEIVSYQIPLDSSRTIN